MLLGESKEDKNNNNKKKNELWQLKKCTKKMSLSST